MYHRDFRDIFIRNYINADDELVAAELMMSEPMTLSDEIVMIPLRRAARLEFDLARIALLGICHDADHMRSVIIEYCERNKIKTH